MELAELDRRIALQHERLANRSIQVECPLSPTGRHDYNGNLFDVDSGRKICRHCFNKHGRYERPRVSER